MSEFYDRMAATALRLIEQFGQPITLRDETPGGYDPATGTVTEASAVEQSGRAILMDYSASESGAANQAGTLIQQSDKKIILAAKGVVAPTLATRVVAAGFTWAVVSIKETSPGGTALVYELQGRR